MDLFFVLAVLFTACSPREDRISIPSPTPPLSRSGIGFAVVHASYTRMMNEPGMNGVSLGYVRERTVLTILERRLVRTEETEEYWILAEGNATGWLPENVIIIYDTEEKASTAAQTAGGSGS